MSGLGMSVHANLIWAVAINTGENLAENFRFLRNYICLLFALFSRLHKFVKKINKKTHKYKKLCETNKKEASYTVVHNAVFSVTYWQKKWQKKDYTTASLNEYSIFGVVSILWSLANE